MRTHRQLISTIKNQHGISAVLTAIMLVMLIGFAALAIDIGYLYSTRNELQNAADAAALAATRKLGELYQIMPYAQQVGYVCGGSDKSSIEAAAQNVAIKNKAAMKTINVPISDIRIGQWDGSSFAATLSQPDAVNVTARREDSANGPIATFFARIFNKNTMAVNATATAALTGKGESDIAELELPIGIDREWFGDEVNPPLNPFPEGFCGKQIKFSPTVDPEACGGWTSWTFNSNDANLRKILEETLQSPPLGVGDPIGFIGGDLSVPTFDDLLTLYQNKGYDIHIDDLNINPDGTLNLDSPLKSPGEPPMPAQGTPESPVTGALSTSDPDVFPLKDADNNPLLYADGATERNAHVYVTSIVVYEADECDNPNQTLLIEGYATIVLTDVLGPPDKLVQGTILCGYVSPTPTRGGGGDYGTKGSIPGLVQ
jgi:hypothetical protein